MKNLKILICLLVAVVFMFAFTGCNNEPADPQGATEQTTDTETTTTSTADSKDESQNSTELFSKDTDDIEIMTAPLPDGNAQKTTDAKVTATAPAETNATVSAETPEQTRIELPFVPAN